MCSVILTACIWVLYNRQQWRASLCRSAASQGGWSGVLQAVKRRQCWLHHTVSDHQAFSAGESVCWDYAAVHAQPEQHALLLHSIFMMIIPSA